MGWDSEAWGFFASKTQWVITGNEYKDLCERAKTFAQDLSQGNRIIMLDNWNEFGEGHYISPTRKYGFMHLDAIRKVFSTNATGQFHIVPEDVGLGPYEYY